jgi:chromosome segregation ATPase
MKNLTILFFLVSSSLLFGQDGISQREAILQELLTLEIQLNNSITKIENLQTALSEIQGKLGVYEELIKSQRERLESLYSDLAGGLEESTSLASGATEDLRDAQGTVKRIRELLDSP